MKNIIVICLVLTCMLILVGCSAPWTDKDIKNSEFIEIRKYDNGELCDVYMISDKNEVNDICKTFSSLFATKLNYHKPALKQYSIHFLDDSEFEIQNINFLFGNTIVTNEQIYAISDEINIIEYIEDIISKSSQE